MEKIGNKTVMCSVLFLDIVEYSKKSVAGQISLKERFNSYLSAAIHSVPVTDRIILDTGDGAAVNFIGDIEDALRTALSLRESLLNETAGIEPRMLMRMGINLGPVRLVMDINGQPNVVGDGVNVAQRIMGFAEPGQILMSRSYGEAVSRLSHKYDGMFHYQGSRTDKHVREHEIYVIGQRGEAAILPPTGEVAPEAASDRQVDIQRRTLYVGAFAVAAVLIGVLALKLNKHDKPAVSSEGGVIQASAQPPVSVAPTDQQPVTGPSVLDSGLDMKKNTANKADNKMNAKAALPPVSAKAKVIEPSGNKSLINEKNGNEKTYITVICRNDAGRVFVDHVQKGQVSSGVLTLVVTPGKHTVLVKHDSGLVHQQNVDLTSGSTASIKPKFCD
jgi:hypothetical protein